MTILPKGDPRAVHSEKTVLSARPNNQRWKGRREEYARGPIVQDSLECRGGKYPIATVLIIRNKCEVSAYRRSTQPIFANCANVNQASRPIKPPLNNAVNSASGTKAKRLPWPM